MLRTVQHYVVSGDGPLYVFAGDGIAEAGECRFALLRYSTALCLLRGEGKKLTIVQAMDFIASRGQCFVIVLLVCFYKIPGYPQQVALLLLNVVTVIQYRIIGGDNLLDSLGLERSAEASECLQSLLGTSDTSEVLLCGSIAVQ